MKFKIFFILLLLLGGVGFWYWNTNAQFERVEEVQTQPEEPVIVEPVFDIEEVEIESGDTFGKVMERAGFSRTETMAILETAKESYDLSGITVGKNIEFYTPEGEDRITKIVYKFDTRNQLVVEREGEEWAAKKELIPYEIEVVTDKGTIENSLYLTAIEKGIDERAIIQLAEIFQWTIDFAMDVRKGDSFELIYEKRYLDGEYVMPGRILAAKYINADEPHYAFFFKTSEENEGYFDESGGSLQRVFLKAPVAYKYITSGFTTGQRYVEAFNTSTSHRAIDYAAPTGTPVRSVGDGTVVFAGWHSSFGNFLKIRHNETYTTNYAHNSKLYVSYGDKVKQGDTVAAVGSTGFSTGPHLHYEMEKFGTKINPLEEEFPASEAVAEEDLPTYLDHIKEYASELGLSI